MARIMCVFVGSCTKLSVDMVLTASALVADLLRGVMAECVHRGVPDADAIRLFLAKKRTPTTLKRASLFLRFGDADLRALCSPLEGDATAISTRRQYLTFGKELLPRHKLTDYFDEDDVGSGGVHVLVVKSGERIPHPTVDEAEPDDRVDEETGERARSSETRSAETATRVVLTLEVMLLDDERTDTAAAANRQGSRANGPPDHSADSSAEETSYFASVKPTYDAIPKAWFDLRPAPVDAAVVDSVHAQMKYCMAPTLIADRYTRARLSISSIMTHVCLTFGEEGYSSVVCNTNITGVQYSGFDFFAYHGRTAIGTTYTKRKRGIDLALVRNWTAAQVVRKPLPLVNMGVVTNLVDWVLIRYESVGGGQVRQVRTREATLQLAGRDRVPTKASLAEIVGLLRQMLLSYNQVME